MRTLVLVLLTLAASARADTASLAESAKAAAAAGRYCEALTLYTQTFALANDPKYLYNAAEVAYAADDKVTALQLFREVLAKFPDYPKRLKVEQRIAELGRSIAKDGAGSACPSTSGTGAGTGAGPTGPAGAKPTGPTTSTTATCGNGLLEGSESCDDGNRIEGDACDSNCTRTSCGNAIRTSGELCDDGNAVSGDGCDANCTTSECGNGVVAAAEQCDDDNTASGDGCSATCTTEVAPGGTSASPMPWIIGGSVTAVVGAAAGIIGFVPAIGYAGRAPALAQLEQDFANAEDPDEQADIGDAVAVANAAQASDVDSYNTWGRWLAPTGLVLVGAGIAIAVVGVVVSSGREEGAE